jgi:hypothetical protein
MAVHNNIDRFYLVFDVINRVGIEIDSARELKESIEKNSLATLDTYYSAASTCLKSKSCSGSSLPSLI